jgi:hypothetical protein
MLANILLLLLSGGFSALGTPLMTTNLLANPGGEANSLTNWVAGGNSGPRLDSGTFDSGIDPHSGTNDFLAGTGSVGTLSQTVPLLGSQGITATAIDTGTLQAYVSFWEQGLNQGTPSDDAYVSLVFMDAASNSLNTWASPEIDSHFLAWANYSNYLPIPTGTRLIQYTMNFVRHVGSDLDAFVDDNVLSVTVSAQVPRLSIAGSETNALVYWPALYSDGFMLQQNTNLSTTNWTQAGGSVTNINGTNQVSISPPVGNQFFRLYHP